MRNIYEEVSKFLNNKDASSVWKTTVFSTPKKGYTPETSVLLDNFDTSWWLLLEISTQSSTLLNLFFPLPNDIKAPY